jgi:hypothetical protein
MTGSGPSDHENHPRDSSRCGEASRLSMSIEQDLRELIDILDQQLLEHIIPPIALQTARAMAEQALRLAERLGAAAPPGAKDP